MASDARYRVTTNKWIIIERYKYADALSLIEVVQMNLNLIRRIVGLKRRNLEQLKGLNCVPLQCNFPYL